MSDSVKPKRLRGLVSAALIASAIPDADPTIELFRSAYLARPSKSVVRVRGVLHDPRGAA